MKRSPSRLPWTVLVSAAAFELAVFFRVFLELRILGNNNEPIVVAHRAIWYNYVFLFFVACYRLILRAPLERLKYLSLGGAILLVPPICAILLDLPFNMNYLASHDPVEIAFEMVTLQSGNEKNYLMFPELFLLLAGTLLSSWHLSRSAPRTFINTVAAFCGAFLTAGFCWFSVEPEHDAVFRISAMLHSQQFYSFQFLGGTVFLALLIFRVEIAAVLRRRAVAPRIAVPSVLFAAVYTLFIVLVAPHHDRALSSADCAVLALPTIWISLTPFLVLDRSVSVPAKLASSLLAGLGLALALAVFFVRVNL